MPPKKKRTRNRSARGAPARKQRRPAASGPAKAADRRLTELAEALDIMLPELSARVAALEHLLVVKEICDRDELIRSREFVDAPRGGFAGEEQQ